MQTTTISQNSSYQNGPTLPSCGPNYTLFTMPLFNPNKVLSVLPLADFIPPDHVFPTPHAYVYTSYPGYGVNKDGAYLYAPTNMVLTDIAIRSLRNTFGVYNNYTDYTLVFQPCKEFYLYFHNVPSLTYLPFINATLQLKKQCGNQVYCEMGTNIGISAGQIIGTIGNASEGIFGVDVGARDYRISTGRDFVDPNRLCPLQNGQPNIFDRCYTVCPYGYFAPSIQQQIHFSNVDGSVNGTSCGTVYQDVNGTAEGYWFPANGSTSAISPEATDIFLGHDNLKAQLGIFSIGVSVPGLPANRYSFTSVPSGMVNRDFANVTSPSVFCYQANSLSGSSYATYGPPTIIYLELFNGNTLQIQEVNGTSCGNGPWAMAPNAARFVR